MAETVSKSVMIKNVRLSYPMLAKAEGYNGGDPRYGANFIIERGSQTHKDVFAVLREAAIAKWGDKGEIELKACLANPQRCCLQPGEAKKLDDSVVVLAAYNKAERPPAIFRGNRESVRDPDDIRALLYPGCYVNAKITIWVQDNSFGKALRASIGGVQFNKHGEPFTVSSAATAEEFDVIEESAQGEPTMGNFDDLM